MRTMLLWRSSRGTRTLGLLRAARQRRRCAAASSCFFPPPPLVLSPLVAQACACLSSMVHAGNFFGGWADVRRRLVGSLNHLGKVNQEENAKRRKQNKKRGKKEP